MLNTKKNWICFKESLIISQDLELSIMKLPRKQGQLIAVKVISVNANYNKLELISGRMTELTEGRYYYWCIR